jgi:hypothetical protein
MRQKRVFSFLVILLSTMLLLSGCGGSSSEISKDDSGYDRATSNTEERALYGLSNQSGSAPAEKRAEGSMNKMPSDRNMDENVSYSDVGAYERKIIREQFIEQQVQDLKGVLEELERSANSISGAYIESLHEWKNEGRNRTEHRAQLILRIPVEHFSAFLHNVEEQGKVVNRQLTGQDVTEEFVDNTSRLRNLKTHEDRILRLYDKAETIEDMLKIENELSRIRSSIEQLEGRQKYLSQVTSTVKLSLELFQVDEEALVMANDDTSLFTEAWIGFKRSIKQLSLLGERSIILLITLLPYLVIMSVFLAIVIIITKKYLKSNNNELKKIKPEDTTKE